MYVCMYVRIYIYIYIYIWIRLSIFGYNYVHPTRQDEPPIGLCKFTNPLILSWMLYCVSWYSVRESSIQVNMSTCNVHRKNNIHISLWRWARSIHSHRDTYTLEDCQRWINIVTCSVVHIWVCMYVYTYEYLCVYTWMYEYMYVWAYVCTYV